MSTNPARRAWSTQSPTTPAVVPDVALQQALREEGLRSTAARTFVADRRAAAQALHEGGASGSEVVACWSESMGRLVCSLFAALESEFPESSGPVAVLALGGFGRAELSPHSDLDLLLLCEGAGEVAPIVQQLLYPLWDAGLTVQGVARSVEENLRIARRSVPSRNNLLDSRFLCGSAELADRFQQEVVEDEVLGREPESFLEALLREMEARHDRYGQTVYLLEPHVKEGEGGLRDIQTALTVARVRYRARSPEDLAREGLVPRDEIRALEEVRDFLLKIRNHLHLASGRREDRLTVALQDEVAQALDVCDTSTATAAEELLRRYYTAANRVGHFSRALMRRATREARSADGSGVSRDLGDGVRFRDGEVHLDPDAVERDPLSMLAAFEAAQVHNGELSPQSLAVIRDHLHLVDDRFRRDPEAVRRFLGILQAPRRVATTLMAMHDVRFLDRFVPEMAHVFGLVRRDFYHSYPVDVHSLFAVQELRRLARGEHAEEFPHYTKMIRDLQRPHILYLATLLHDVGKGSGQPHEQRGAELAIQVADRMDLEPEERDYLEFLVREHLLLSHTAQNRDLHDEELIREFTRRVGDLEALKMLYLLTFADSRAVGPGAWSGWKQTLFRELFDKAERILAGAPVRRGATAERVEAVRARLRSAALRQDPPAPPEAVKAFLDHVDHPRYLTANSVEGLLRHLDVFLRRDRAPVIELREVPDEGYTEVLLLTKDHPGLFVQVAGVMAAHGIDIRSAVLNTRKDGWVLDVFHAAVPRGESSADDYRWWDWRNDMISVLRGERTLQEVLGSRLEPRSVFRAPAHPIQAAVEIDNEVSRHFTVIDVSAGDRLGLLYDLTRTLKEHGLSIHLAKIVTQLHRVADSFYAETLEGGKLEEGEALRRLRDDLLAVAEGPPKGEENR